MGINLTNFLSSQSKNTKMIDFQDLDHIDGLSISVLSANLYKNDRDDLSMFYFRDGANHASLYTQSKIVSENIKWNLNQKTKKVFSLIVNTRNANAFTGKQGYESLKKLADLVSKNLTDKQKQDEETPRKINPKEILFGCTGTIGEEFPFEKISHQIPNLISKIRYTQNKFIWMKVALGIMTTDTKPKIAMEECNIGSEKVKIYGIAKGSGMIHPNMATTLAYIFTDASLSNDILRKLLKKNIFNTFNAISCDGDTSTNDMVTIFATNQINNSKIKSINENKIKNFDKALNNVLLNLAKRVVADGEGASKFISINVSKCKNELEKNVNLVKFENNRIEISFNDNLDKNFVKDLSLKLFEWTAERWIITFSKSKGEMSVKEKQLNNKKLLIDEVKTSEAYKNIIENFPDAELIDVKIKKDEGQDD